MGGGVGGGQAAGRGVAVGGSSLRQAARAKPGPPPQAPPRNTRDRSLTFRAESIILTNRRNSPHSFDFSSPSFGEITNTLNEVGLRLHFAVSLLASLPLFFLFLLDQLWQGVVR